MADCKLFLITISSFESHLIPSTAIGVEVSTLRFIFVLDRLICELFRIPHFKLWIWLIIMPPKVVFVLIWEIQPNITKISIPWMDINWIFFRVKTEEWIVSAFLAVYLCFIPSQLIKISINFGPCEIKIQQIKYSIFC